MARGGQPRERRAKRGWQVPLRWPVLVLLLLSTRVSFAQWDLTHAGDPNRNWGVIATEAVGYDDNFNGSAKNPQAGIRYSSDLKLRASVPLERFFAGMQYEYTDAYPKDLKLGGVLESHNVAVTANYTISPRLSLNVSENFVNSIDPKLVQGPAGPAQTIVQAGSYIYDNVGGG